MVCIPVKFVLLPLVFVNGGLISDLVGDVVKPITSTVDDVGKVAIGTVDSALKTPVDLIQNVGNFLQHPDKFLKNVSNLTKHTLNDVEKDSAAFVQNVTSNIKDVAPFLLNLPKNVFTGVKEVVTGEPPLLLNLLLNFLPSYFKWPVRFLYRIYTLFKAVLRLLPRSAKQTVINLLKTLFVYSVRFLSFFLSHR